MNKVIIGELLLPFVSGTELAPQLLDQLQTYLDLLLRWNARVNLTAVRDPEQIVTRHFGESLFAAQTLAAHSGFRSTTTLADVGAGAGFPGIPIKLLLPEIQLTLIESQNKKATFLREAVRALALKNADVFCGRAEQWQNTAGVITLRAVEQFTRVLPVAASRVGERGLLGLLIGEEQIGIGRQVMHGEWKWSAPVAIPNSQSRCMVIAERLT